MLLLIRVRMADAAGVVELNLCRLPILALDRVVHFSAMNRNLARGLNAKPDLITAHIYYGDNDVIANNDTFVALSG
jgi:hypothetical protein